MPNRGTTKQQREQMVKLAQDHYSGPEIAKKMGCSTNTVYYQLNQYADEHHISRQSLRVQEHKQHVFDNPMKTWPLGSHQKPNPKEEVSEANVEDTAVVADSKDAKHDPCKDDIDKLIDKIREMLARNNEIIERLEGSFL